MDLAAPHDEVLAQKDQANTAFLLHGYGLDSIRRPIKTGYIIMHVLLLKVSGLVLAGVHRNSTGGFGAVVLPPSFGGSYG